jgi:hypothetical protein
MKNMLMGIVLLHSESGYIVLMVKKHHNNAQEIMISLFYRSCWDTIHTPQELSLLQFQSREEQILESGYDPKCRRKLKRE